MEPSELRSTVAQNIRAIAAEQGIALNALADFSGVSRSQLFNVLGGSSSATLDWLARIADTLGVEPSRLLEAPREVRKRPRS